MGAGPDLLGVIALGESEADGEQWLGWRFPGRLGQRDEGAAQPLAQP